MLTLLLPPWQVLERQGDAYTLARMRARGDAQPQAAAGRRAQQLRIFDVVPKPPPWAAITRQMDCGDASGSTWLRADPAYLRVESGGLRLMAYGAELALSESDAQGLAALVRPLFHDLGMQFSAPNARRWYVQLARGRPMPAFIDPENALGSLQDPLPPASGTTREWTRVFNEAQMLLHDHPISRGRAQRGLLPVNSLWLWGAGEVPLKVASAYTAMLGDDEEYRALALAAKLALPDNESALFMANHPAIVVDARRAPRGELLGTALFALKHRHFKSLRLDSEDGTIFDCKRWHGWRFWR